MKRIRYVLLVLLAMICMSGAVTASAADDRLGTIVDGSLLTEGTSVEFETAIGSSLARGKYFGYGRGSITLTSSGTVNLFGATFSTQSVDKIKVKLYLQKLEGSSWNTLYISPTKVAYNTYYVSKSVDKTVSGGAYYRIATTHIVMEGDTTESASSYSDGLWVD